jgi:hypothetical protein
MNLFERTLTLGSGDLLRVLTTRGKYSLKINEEASYLDIRKLFLNQLSGTLQFCCVMYRLPLAVSTECRKAAVSRAIGVAHQKHARCLV